MTETECRKIVSVLLGAFANARITQDTVAIYERMIRDQDYAVANAAVERLLATSKFMPSIAEIREACLDLNLGERKAGGEAWGEVLRAVSRFGGYRVPGTDFVFSDAVVGRCVDALGWKNLCTSENQISDRARFVELYDKLAVGDRKQKNAGELPAHKRLEESRSHPALPSDEATDEPREIVLRLAASMKAKP